MRQQLLARARALGLPGAQLAPLLQRLHFGTQPAARLASWLPQLLARWQSPRRVVQAAARPAAAAGAAAAAAAEVQLLSSGRLDAAYSWIPWPLSGVSAEVALTGSDCAWPAPPSTPPPRLDASVALILLTSLPGASEAAGGGQRCGYERMLSAAQRGGARAVMFAAPRGAHLAEVNCTGEGECGTAIAIPATLVPYMVGEVVRNELEAGGAVTATFRDVQVGA